jgi:hypothetical protein
MELCDYGCGDEARYTFKNGKHCCSEKYRSCPHQAKKIGKTRIGKKHSEETKRKIGDKSKARIEKNGGSYFKGKTHSEETIKKMSERMLGNVPWNKGLTKETDDRVLQSATKNMDGRTANVGKKNGMYGKTHSNEVKELSRQRNLKLGRWQGEDNPWFGKDRSGENSPRFLDKSERTEWEQYKIKVRSLTEQMYSKFKTEINPQGLKRGTREYHLDHIIPLWFGFRNNILPDILAQKENLRMLLWNENLSRCKESLTDDEMMLLEDLTIMYKENNKNE